MIVLEAKPNLLSTTIWNEATIITRGVPLSVFAFFVPFCCASVFSKVLMKPCHNLVGVWLGLFLLQRRVTALLGEYLLWLE
ncbi:hypothetical protein ASPSYDRAFT_1025914 [Aspergillus sydowii CBS 593.65]|uniref:Uncharacterized protein n=1 Tax=Aspergillus sydowii CBS 593.65 TaxID=1036612 RepID=A0A1L9TFB1_9EURO|nr:uncharacterized protein ASPSYDRAFT_1025914 [Aspergillus sydowii CBS 593.65]OJJ58061.1 hypothetical protein ASPSYDRAFT_1025914 [Aspergillus sydowii CBS 593.65]